MNVRLIVPNCNRNTSPIVAYGPAIADIAGGFTATQGTGGWKDDQGNLVVEPVTVFDCDCTQAEVGNLGRYPGNCREQFRSLAKRIAVELNQDCVYLAIDNQVEFVKQPAKVEHANKWI